MLSELTLHRGTPNVLAHSVVTIDKPAEELYAKWKDLESIPYGRNELCRSRRGAGVHRTG